MLGGVGADPFPHLERWLDALRQRPATIGRVAAPWERPLPDGWRNGQFLRCRSESCLTAFHRIKPFWNYPRLTGRPHPRRQNARSSCSEADSRCQRVLAASRRMSDVELVPLPESRPSERSWARQMVILELCRGIYSRSTVAATLCR